MDLDSLILYENISQVLTMEGVDRKKGRSPTEADLGIIENAAVVVNAEESRIHWIGAQSDLPKEYKKIFQRSSCAGEVWMPELVECHTHLVFAGNRYKDFASRCAGKTYQQIAAEGGGILSTIQPTRNATVEELLSLAMDQVDRFQKMGVGTIEIKTGYGLTLESELKMLHVIRKLQDNTSVILIPTFLPGHAVPPEFKGKVDDYVEAICREWIPEVGRQKLANFVDTFIEEGFFTAAQGRKIAEAALQHGMKLKFHVDQFSDQRGTDLGIELGAQSLDHLEKISDTNVKKLGEVETVAVLCPGASLFTKYDFPPARKLVDAGARVALSTDFNPGTCPSRNLPLMTTLATCQMGMTVAEAVTAVTYNAAAALGLEERLGVLAVGRLFRVTTITGTSYAALPYSFGEL